MKYLVWILRFSEDCYNVHVEIENEDVELQIADTAGEVRSICCLR